MPTRTDNTFQEELTKLLTSIAQMKALPDADLQFLTQLETMVLSQLRAPIDAMQAQGMTNAPSSLAVGAPAGGPGPQGPPPGPGGGGGGGLPGVPSMVGAGLPNPDELRRLLNGGGNNGGGR